MQYDGRFRFKSIDPRRFYDGPSMAFIASVGLVVAVQVGLMLAGKPGLRALLSS